MVMIKRFLLIEIVLIAAIKYNSKWCWSICYGDEDCDDVNVNCTNHTNVITRVFLLVVVEVVAVDDDK